MNRGIFAIAFAALLGIIVLVVVVGGGDDGEDGSDEPTADITDTTVKPTVEVPDEPPPDELVVEDIVEGEGPEAKKGDQLTMQYVGVLYENGEQFDASWDTGQPFPFELGAGQVIRGWDEGLEGIKAGGRRMLTIPADLAYGPQGSPPTIPPDATLVFVVDAVSID